MSWKDRVDGYMERGATYSIAGVNKVFGNDPAAHLTWGLLFVEFPKMSPELFKEITTSFEMVDTIDERTFCIKLFAKEEFIVPGCTPAVYSQAEVLKPPSGDWWHLSSMKARGLAYPICNSLHEIHKAEIYWVIDIYPLKLAKVMTLDEFNKLAAEQRPQEYGVQITDEKIEARLKIGYKTRDVSPTRE